MERLEVFIKNINKINKDLMFPCKSNKLKKFLVEVKGLQYATRIYDEKDKKYIWCFMRNDDLGKALIE